MTDVSITSKHTWTSLDDDGRYRVYQAGKFPHEGGPLAEVRFQEGPVREAGVNGCFVEDLLTVAVHRLRKLDMDMHSPDNEAALRHMLAALGALNARAAGRLERGVQGTSEP
jgi:hypothetical protein